MTAVDPGSLDAWRAWRRPSPGRGRGRALRA